MFAVTAPLPYTSRMALVVGPLHSDQASGTIGDVTYCNPKGWRRRAFCRDYYVTPNPRTLAQVANRAAFRCGRLMWATFDQPTRDYWKQRADMVGNPFTGSEWMRWLYKCWAHGTWHPSATITRQHFETPDPPTDLTATPGPGRLEVRWTDNPAAYTTAILLGPTDPFEITNHSLFYMAVSTGAATGWETQIAPGTYYACGRSGGTDGGYGIPSACIGPFTVT
jgi:hypothetical protein